MSVSEKSKCSSALHLSVRSPNETSRPIEEGEASATTSETGKRRSARIASISRPTFPVAPATATLKPDMRRIPLGSASPRDQSNAGLFEPRAPPRGGAGGTSAVSRSSRLSGRRALSSSFSLNGEASSLIRTRRGKRRQRLRKPWRARVVNAAPRSCFGRGATGEGQDLGLPSDSASSLQPHNRPNWQRCMNEALKKSVGGGRQP